MLKSNDYFCMKSSIIDIWKGFNPIQDGPKICHTYLTMMKLGTVIPYLKKIQKIYKSRDTPLSPSDISIFSPEIIKFCYIKKCRCRFHFET